MSWIHFLYIIEGSQSTLRHMSVWISNQKQTFRSPEDHGSLHCALLQQRCPNKQEKEGNKEEQMIGSKTWLKLLQTTFSSMKTSTEHWCREVFLSIQEWICALWAELCCNAPFAQRFLHNRHIFIQIITTAFRGLLVLLSHRLYVN